jgi:hypothetical protein
MFQRRSAIGVAAFVDSVRDQKESEHQQCARNQGMDEVDRVSHPVIQIRKNLRLSSHEEESPRLPHCDVSRALVQHARCPKSPECLVPFAVAGDGTGERRRRLRAFPALLTHVGKELDQFEEVDAGLEHDPDEIWTEYLHPNRDSWRSLVLPVLRTVPRVGVTEGAGISERALRALLSGSAAPWASTRAKLLAFAVTHARCVMCGAGRALPAADLAACAAYVEWHQLQP